MNTRRICVVVTARPSYSRIKTALVAIRDHPNLELQLVVAASALLDRYGSAVEVIKRDGFSIAAKVFNVLEGENLTAMARTTGLGTMELASVFERLNPDAVVTVADRFETLATATAAAYMNIPLVHVQGGEVTGSIDEKVRHAVTKLADLHLVASDLARDRVVRMGEDPQRVVVTGCPSIDLAVPVLQNGAMDFDPLERYGGVGDTFDVSSSGYIVVVQHPVTTEYELARGHIDETLHAVHSLKIPVFWFWPNVDAGADGTSKGIRAFRENHECQRFHFFKNMEPVDFLRLLKNSQCLIGNSSVGIRECAYLGIPVVNIGTRQSNRERGDNVVDVGYDRSAIVRSIQAQLARGHIEANELYGDGSAGVRIANALATAPLTFQKVLTY
ncbi:MAG: UDP-hydrolyzing UDP-N-acetyl-D-glucosamine 2-epimerase [Verrucomicrobiales bacterium]|jgi:UDP-hydrolysing UDP-N-acetyl-D-glucosamine 2-epimerase